MSLDALGGFGLKSSIHKALGFYFPNYGDMLSNRYKQLLSEINLLETRVIEEKRIRTTLEAALSVLGVPVPELPEQEDRSQEEQLESEVDWLKSELRALRDHLTLLEIKSVDSQRCFESKLKQNRISKCDRSAESTIQMLSDLQRQMHEELQWMTNMNEMEKIRNNQLEQVLVEGELQVMLRDPILPDTQCANPSECPRNVNVTKSEEFCGTVFQSGRASRPKDNSFDIWTSDEAQRCNSRTESIVQHPCDDFSFPGYSGFHLFPAGHSMMGMRAQELQGVRRERVIETIPTSLHEQSLDHFDSNACSTRDSDMGTSCENYTDVHENREAVRAMKIMEYNYSHPNEAEYFIQKSWDSVSWDPEIFKYEDKAMIKPEPRDNLDDFPQDSSYRIVEPQETNPDFQFDDDMDCIKDVSEELEDVDQRFVEFESEFLGWEESKDNIIPDNYEGEVTDSTMEKRGSLNSVLNRAYKHVRNPTPFEIPPIDLTNFKSPTISKPIFEDCTTSERCLASGPNSCAMVKDFDDAYSETLCDIAEKMVEYMASVYQRHVYRLTQSENSKKKTGISNPLRLAKRIGFHSNKKKSSEPTPKLSSWYSFSSRMKLFKVPEMNSNSSDAGSPTKDDEGTQGRIQNCNYSDSEADFRNTETDSEFLNFEDTVSTSSSSPSMDVCKKVPLSCMAGRDPYGIDKDRDPLEVGTYSSLLECSSVPPQPRKTSCDLISLKKFETLVKELDYLDPRKLNHDERLAFWINIYNSILMHAYIIKGCPSNYAKRILLMGKTTVNVAGHSISALDIEYGILRAHSHRSPMAKSLKVWLPVTAAPHDVRSTWSLTKSEPLVTFALASGTRSSPRLQIYNRLRVRQQMENAKYAFMRAAVGLNRSNKLSIPKLVLWYSPDFCVEEKLVDWVFAQLPPKQTAAIVDRLSQLKQPSKKLAVEFAPYDWGFRYLFEPKLKGDTRHTFK